MSSSSSSSITKVALAGATGNLGPAILKQLVDAEFEVTVLTRQSGNDSLPSAVTVKAVNYDSLDSLTGALQGQDAVVSTLASNALDKQLNLIQAAANAHVKRFIPSEFGGDTLNEKNAVLPVFKDKIAVQDALKKEAASDRLPFTLIFTGPFLDWGLMVGFIPALKNKVVSLFDGGDRPFSTTSLATIGKAVVGVLQHLDQTKDRAVYVQDTATTVKELAAMGKNSLGPNGWKETVVSVDELVEQAWAELKKPQPNPEVFVYNFLIASTSGEGHGGHFQKLDNELLGIKDLSDAELQSLVDRVAK